MDKKSNAEQIIKKMVVLPEKNSDFVQRETNLFHTPYAFEKYIRNCFKFGDIDGYEKACKEMVTGQTTLTIGKVSDNQFRQLKYACVTFGALGVRAAIEGGLLEMEAYDYSDKFLRKIDSANTIEEISAAFDVMHEIIFAVRNIRIRNTDNIKIRKCQNYIHNNLHGKITREDLVKISGLTPAYLSNTFLKETGKSITQYIASEKINEAKKLIMEGELSFIEIAYTLGFCSQSHFTYCFRRETGLTPMQYKKST